MRKNRNIMPFFYLLLFALSVFLLAYQLIWSPYVNRKDIVTLKEEFQAGTLSPGDISRRREQKPAGTEEGVPSVDMSSLQEKYPDIKGWLTIPGTVIDYPVLQSGESAPQYYIHRNYKGDRDRNGSLFLQWNCDVSEGANLIIYGHNMNGGQMFGELDRYAGESFYDAHRTVFFQTAAGSVRYQVVSFFKADVKMFDFQRTVFQTAEMLQGYLEQAVKRGMFKDREDAALSPGSDQIMTLVTCSYEWEGARNILIAVKK